MGGTASGSGGRFKLIGGSCSAAWLYWYTIRGRMGCASIWLSRTPSYVPSSSASRTGAKRKPMLAVFIASIAIARAASTCFVCSESFKRACATSYASSKITWRKTSSSVSASPRPCGLSATCSNPRRRRAGSSCPAANRPCCCRGMGKARRIASRSASFSNARRRKGRVNGTPSTPSTGAGGGGA